MKSLLFKKLDERKGSVKVIDCDKSIYSKEVLDSMGLNSQNSIAIANISKNASMIEKLTGIKSTTALRIVSDNKHMDEENIIIDDTVHMDSEAICILLDVIKDTSNLIILGDNMCVGITDSAFDLCKEYEASKNRKVESIREPFDKKTIEDCKNCISIIARD